jgi:hypothetical protein
VIYVRSDWVAGSVSWGGNAVSSPGAPVL